MRIAIWYILTLFGFSFYGGVVCPFIESLGWARFTQDLVLIFSLVFTARLVSLRMYSSFSKAEYQNSKMIFLFEFGFMSLIGIAVTVFNTTYYEFPLGSGLKFTTGTLTIGFFLGLDSSLRVARHNLEQKKIISPQKHPASTIIRGFSFASVTTVILTTAVILLVVIKDLEWIITLDQAALRYGIQSTLIELLFIMLVLLVLIIHLIATYATNLKILFSNQIQTLEQVIQGNYEHYVPVVSTDEFGRIGEHTNLMIDDLRQKEKINSVLGKVVSKPIAERLLSADGKHNLEGVRQNLVIMMADIRDFTSMSEKLVPENLVSLLNRYFGCMVEIIHKHNGIVDKFIGDGLFAVFGLQSDNLDQANNLAVDCATEMLREAGKLEQSIQRPFKIGIAIHCGEVIAGRIGAKERLEYTFIGDTVNTTARMEAANKEVGTSLIISDIVHTQLTHENKERPWQGLPNLRLKGKQSELQAYGM